MAKKKRPKNQNHLLQIKTEGERRKIRAVRYLFPAVSVLLFLIAYPNFLNNPEVSVTSRVICALALGVLFPARGATGSTMDCLLQSKDVQIEKLRTVYRVFNIISVSILALLIFPLIYYSPLREQVSIFLVNLQAFSKGLVNNISTALSAVLATISGYILNIVLGALGNLFYDITKSGYSRWKLENNKRASKKRK